MQNQGSENKNSHLETKINNLETEFFNVKNLTNQLDVNISKMNIEKKNQELERKNSQLEAKISNLETKLTNLKKLTNPLGLDLAQIFNVIAIHRAAALGDIDTLKIIVENGDVNMHHPDGWTALQEAACPEVHRGK